MKVPCVRTGRDAPLARPYQMDCHRHSDMVLPKRFLQRRMACDGCGQLSADFLPYECEADDGVMIEPRLNDCGRLFLHVLNFRDTDGAFRIVLKRNALVRAYDFGGSEGDNWFDLA